MAGGPQVVQWRGGPTTQAEVFIGMPKEITVDTDKWVMCLHDGITAGGHELGAQGDAPEHRWIGTQLQLKQPSGEWGTVVDFTAELTQAQIDAITAQGTTEIARVVSEGGDVQVARVTSQGDTEVARVTAQGTTEAGLVTAEGTAQISLVGDKGVTEIATVGAEGTTQVDLVSAQGTTSVDLVTAEGTTQIGLVTSQGDTEIVAVIAEGDTQDARVITQGDYQVSRLTDETVIAAIAAEGATQIGLVEDEGDAQILRLQTEGVDEQLAALEAEGDTQVARVTTQGDTEIARVESEGGDVQVARVISQGTTEVAGVIAEGIIQTGVVTTQGTTEIARVVSEGGDVQVARVVTEGDTQVARVTSVGVNPYDIGDAPYYLYDMVIGSDGHTYRALKTTSVDPISAPVGDWLDLILEATAGITVLGEFNVSNWAPDTTKIFTLPVPADTIPAISVTVREQNPQIGITNNDWAIVTDDAMFDLRDSAYTDTLTLGAVTGETTAILTSGTWTAGDIGKRIVGNEGKAIITSQSGDTANITVTDDFANTNPMTSGNWEMYTGQFADGSFSLSGFESVDWDAWDGTADGVTAVFESANTARISSVVLDATRVLLCYQDTGNSSYGTTVVLTVNSDNTITPGIPTVFNSASSNFVSVALVDTDKVIVCYRNGDTTYGTTCVLSISGTTITPATPIAFESANTGYISVCKIDTNKALVCYQDAGNSNYGTACVLEVSGPTVTPGTPWIFESAALTYASITQLDTDKAIVCFNNAATTGDAYVLTITGTSIAKGASATFESANSTHISVATLSSIKAIVCYSDVGNSNYGTACVLNISGTTITPGTPAVFESASSAYISAATLDATRAIVGYRDVGNSSYGTACVLTVSGSAITPDTPAVFESASSAYISATLLDSGHVVISYQDTGDSSYGTAKILNGLAAIYVSNQHVSAVTNSSGQINTEFFTDLNSLTPSDTLNGEEANYGITTDGITYEIVGDGESTLRDVVKFDTVWKYNSNITYGSETWTAASVDDLNVAIEEAMAVAQNQMSSATAAAVLDATWPDFEDIFGAFMCLYSDNSSVTPSVEQISFNYDANAESTENPDYRNTPINLNTLKIVSPSGGSTINCYIRVVKG